MTYSLAGLNAWANSINGKWLDLDYAPKQHLWQCHDVFLSYIVQPMFALSVGDGHAPGTEYTDQVWRNFPTHRPALAQKFTKYSGTAIQAGDIVFWARYGAVGGLPHVAVALSAPDPQGRIYCVTQNPGAVQHAWLSTAGVLGGLRPITESAPISGGLPMFAPYWTGPTPASTRISGRIITDYGSFHVPTPQIMNLLHRRHTAALKPGMDNDNMLDAEHDIINAYLRSCFQSAQTGVALDAAKMRAALTDALKELGKSIVVNAETFVSPEDLAKAFESATPRIVASMLKQAGEKLAK